MFAANIRAMRVLSLLVLLVAFAGCSIKHTDPRDGRPPAALPQPPADVTVSNLDGMSQLNWGSVSQAINFNVYWSATPGITKTNSTKVTGITPAIKLGGFVNGQTYFARIATVGKLGEGALSSEFTLSPANGAGTADPLFADQWHITNTGQAGNSGVAGTVGEDMNVAPVWAACGALATCRGEGVTVAIVDGGLEIGHEDLIANVLKGKSFNYTTGTTDPTEPSGDSTSGHGTMVGGIVAARDLNDLGVRGVAPRAALVGYNFLQEDSSSTMVDALTRDVANISIFNNSWGPGNADYGMIGDFGDDFRDAITAGLTTGRGGLGSIYVFAAGNSHNTSPTGGPFDCLTCGGNANLHSTLTNRGTIAVAGVLHDGSKADYSEEGANIWVSAPSGLFCSTHTITTVDRTGASAGINQTGSSTDYTDKNYTKCMNGTSAATPNVSGVVALMLQANPLLGWRDVKYILANTARQNVPGDASWTTNGSGKLYSPKFGFGVVDAEAAVAAAVATGAGVFGTEKTFESVQAVVNTAIPDANAVGVTSTISVAASGITAIEYIEVTFSASDHTYMGDLEIFLRNTTTGGVTSQLAVVHDLPDGSPSFTNWVFGDAQHFGEAANGTWELVVKDRSAGDTGTFENWSMKIFGH